VAIGLSYGRHANPDLESDPFGERRRLLVSKPVALLGRAGTFREQTTAGCGSSRTIAFSPAFSREASEPRGIYRIVLQLTAGGSGRRDPSRATAMLSGAGLLAERRATSSFVGRCRRERLALVVFPESMLRFPYHAI
jgi:hypothetical protein